ncbi:hypothetical protein GCM10022409_48420 [Hymenobacter glaciei]|uniref:Uncharacterized protein n=1 Tax=Hymenobacter glaciei TaxID=877209 RepID=A0ABP7UZE0_9BACT
MYELEKWVWTEADFAQMGWHDATIYAVQFGKDISFDIDYIFEWVQADKDDFFSFYIAPVTLIFSEPRSIVFNVNFRFGQQLEIEGIHRRITDAGLTEWCLETHQGDIIIITDSFQQIIRCPPTLQIGQQIMLEERGESSFSRVPDAAFVASEEVRGLKEADFALRQKAAELRQQQRRLEILREQRSAGALAVKPYLLAKRGVEQRIRELRDELRAANEYL